MTTVTNRCPSCGRPFTSLLLYDDEVLISDMMGATIRIINGLANVGIMTCGEARRRTDSDLLQIKHFGRKSLFTLREELNTIRES